MVSPQVPRQRPDFSSIAALINPAHPSSPWPGELLALSAEESIPKFLTALQAGKSQLLRGMVTRELSGQTLDASGEAVEQAGEALLSSLKERLQLNKGAQNGLGVMEVSVIEVEAPELLSPDAGPTQGSRRGRTVAQIKLGTRPETNAASRTQIYATLEVVWRLGRRVKMVEISLLSLKETVIQPAFREVTGAVMEVDTARDGSLESVLRSGAVEVVGRTDRLVPSTDINLAMHGAAVGDLNGDGWEDVVVGRAGGQPNLCFINDGGRLKEEGAIRGLDSLEDTGGVLIADMDGDGARDVIFGRGSDVAVAWNDGTGHFMEITTLRSPGGTSRVYSLSAADIDGDGDLDLYDTRYFRVGGYGTQAPLPYHDAMNGAKNVFWRNLLVDDRDASPRTFRDDTAAVGLDVDNDRFSLSSVFDDFDGDGQIDLYVANDFGQNNLYLWNGTRFDVSSEKSGLTDKAAGMGVSVADVDLDGQSDIVISNMHSAAGMRVTREAEFGLGLSSELRAEFKRHARGNTLYKGLGAGQYRDVTDMTGASTGGWAWGGRFVDWDRDGLVDIVVPNGFLSGRVGPDLQSFFWRRVVGTTPTSGDAADEITDRYLGGWAVISHLSQFGRQHWNAHERTFAYGNRGGFKFDDVTLASGIGFADDGRALVTADLDRDGRLDLVFRNRTSPILRVLQGIHKGGGWVSLTLTGEAPNLDAIGAGVRLEAGGVVRMARVTAGDGFLGSATKSVHFGLGELEAVDAVSVTWPDGTVESFDVKPGGAALLNGAWSLVKSNSQPQLLSRGEAPMPALDRSLLDPMPAAEPGPLNVRVPLLEEFPLGAWRLPFFLSQSSSPEDGARRIDEASGPSGTFVFAWSTKWPSSVQAVEQLRAVEAQLEAAGIRVHPLCMDGVRDEAAALEVLGQAGFDDEHLGGRITRIGRAVIELVASRTLAPYDDVPLPLGLLFDAEGDLVCMNVGGLDLVSLLDDVGRMAGREDPSSTLALTGGRWSAEAPARLLDDVPDKLRSLGLNELADFLAARR